MGPDQSRRMGVGDLVSWRTPSGRRVVALVVEEEVGHGGGVTGWYRVFADVGHGPRKHLARESHCTVERTP